MPRRSDDEVVFIIQGDSQLNKARQAFSAGAALLEQAGQQKTPLSPIEMRRIEIEVVERILAVFSA